MEITKDGKIGVKLVGKEGDQWPILEKLWDYYSLKGIKVVFMNIGTSSSPLVELEIAETMGCPLHIFEVRQDKLDQWEEVKKILKERKREEGASSFTEGVDTKWVLPKNIRIYPVLPSFSTGTQQIADIVYPTKEFIESAKECCKSMSLKEENGRADIVKISLGKDLEIQIVYSLLSAGYRPGLLMVEWTSSPDEILSTTIVAGHLQTCGYTLIANLGNRCIYFHNDRCMYEICSWLSNKVDNPMISEIVDSFSTKQKIGM
jgi:hypothetical protein